MHKRFKIGALATTMAFVMALAPPVSANPVRPAPGFLTSQPAFITLDPAMSRKAYVKPIISTGDTVGDFVFEGIPDGIGVKRLDRYSVEVYVAHEQSTVPFRDQQDFQDASVSKLTISRVGGPLGRGSVTDASVAISADEGFLRFCSASMATPAEGMDTNVFFTGEETSNSVDGVQRGFAVALDTATGEFTAIPGMGRLNHENTVLVPGRWDQLAMLTTDDTFSAGTSQLYMYLADDQDAVFADEGSLWAFRVTGADGVPLADAADPFNGANDYLDLDVGESFQGEFIPVPREVALGDQDALEDWSNDNNVFQSIRLEDLAYDKLSPRTVYIADTGGSRILPDPATGRMSRPDGAQGMADNGRIIKMVMNADDPTIVDSFSIMADGDAVGTEVFVPMRSPDNLDTSRRSLMVQEDASESKIWQYSYRTESWRVIASVNDPGGESTGIVDASRWFGRGHWILAVQAHSTNVAEDATTIPGTLIKRESGQLMLLKIPGS